MKTIPKHFRLVNEGPDHYEIHDARDKKHFRIAKRDLDLGMHAKLSKIQKFDEGGEAEAAAADTSAVSGSDSDSSSGQPPVTVNVNSAPLAPAIQPPPMVASPVTQGAPAPQIVQPPRMAPNAPLSRQAQAAEGLTEKGTQEQAAAGAQESAANAQVLQDNNARMQALMDGVAEKRKSLDTENQSLTQAVMDKKIDPNQWWNNKSLPGKISTVLGVILGGVGAGLQHSTINQAMEVVQNSIKQDIDAQKEDLGKKQTLLSMNLEKYRNLDAATSATMAQMNAMVEGQLKLNAAKTGSQKAQAAADLAVGMNRMKYISELPGLAMADFQNSVRGQLAGEASAPSAAARILNPDSSSPLLNAVRGKAGVSATPSAAAASVSGPDPEPQLPDIFREQQASKGQSVPVSPLEYGAGVNIKKLKLLNLSGQMDKDQYGKAVQEYGDYTRLQRDLKNADKTFDLASHYTTYTQRIADALQPKEIEGGGSFISDIIKPIATLAKSGLTVGQENPKKYAALVDPFVDELAKDTTGKVNPLAVESIKKAMPQAGDSPETRAIKRSELKEMIKKKYSFQTLVTNGLVHPNDPLVSSGD